MVCGVDEVGRGCLVGDVVAAAVYWAEPDKIHPEIRDSKTLSAQKRAMLYDYICTHAAVGVGSCTPQEIDRLNIFHATMLAMQRAVAALPVPVTAALIDGNKAPMLSIPAYTLVKGDNISASIASASIVAKHLRDTQMIALDARHPLYGFAQHKGYGTKQHLYALRMYGALAEHRRSFAPVAVILQQKD
jgi:ribonuclease HII